MLVIGARQRAAFETAAVLRFEGEMLTHAGLYFPNHMAILGRQRARRVIALGIERAALYGLIGRSDVCRYINLMWMFGSYFDDDPLLPWASAILAERSRDDPSTNLARLARRALAEFAHMAGPEHAYLNRALLRLRHVLAQPKLLQDRDHLPAHLQGLLAALHPAKSARLTPPAYAALLAVAADKSAQHGLQGSEATLLIALSMFYAGSRFDTDPQHGWAGAALTSVDQDSAPQRLERLMKAAREQLALWLARED
ncbi:hypothetical protein [Duganella violaceipulchra]|uniref:Uncharacterized protein n=1 Tax=Duganella violaceipulchra TaxID=2849652 RepID=A0AA41L3B9_9BURK|nr:hypothetical protein [Duganella violaceicalia]MBV6319527.1 hypothetical protein [Duganella violaceicalia]MCP2006660.1 hypothetical protein [Duganella violaceicalia]